MVSSINSSSYLSASIAKLSQQLFNLIDQDSDGSVTKTDLQSLSEESSSVIDDFISKVDATDDQAITQQEFASALAKLFQEMKSSSTGDVAAAVTPPPPPPDSSEIFSLLDADGDGALTLEELEAGGVPDAEKIFGEIDTDSDGKISQAESNAFDEKMKMNGPQVAAENEGSSVNLTSAQTELFNTLMELIAQSGSYTDSATQIKSVFA